jgi:sortase A
MRRLSRWRRVSVVVEGLLVVIGLASLTTYGWFTIEMRRLESENRSAVARMLSDRVAAAEAPASITIRPPAVDPVLLGQLDIPRLRLSAAIRAGDDDDALDGAVGYLPDTPPPWKHGNTALVAHRDRLFRALADIQVGDEIVLSTTHGDFRYVVSSIFIANPTDVWILDQADDVDLTLITCYPFVYIGHAPQRFVVRATKADSET